MENSEFATYSYKVDNAMRILTGIAVGSVFLAVSGAGIISPWCLLLLLLPVGIFIYVKRSGINKPLLIAGRYLILGERIIYYRSVTRAALDQQKQTLTLFADKGKSLVIDADKFPTDARKDFKIKANKTAKFQKVSEKIIARLQAASSDIVIS